MSIEIKAVIFDLYGTLIYNHDTNPYGRLFVQLGLSPDEMRLAKRIAMTEDFTDLTELVSRIKPGAKIIDLTSYEQEVAAGISSARTFPETYEVLEALQKRDLQIGLISNLASPYKKSFFDLGLEKYFASTIFSCEVGLRKPDPKIYERAMQDLKLEPAQAFMVGDTLHSDVEGPISMGMKAILIDRSNKYTFSIQSLTGIFRYL